MNPDPASLENLRDIVLPPPIPWWPPAPGWYVVGALLLGVLSWGIWKAVCHWHRNAYRREALRELATLDRADAVELAQLLRRVALSIFPRDKVTALMGAAWPDFLNSTLAPKEKHPRWDWLDLVYRGGSLPPERSRSAVADTEYWLRHHRQPERRAKC